MVFGLEAFVPAVFGIQIVGFVCLLCGNFIYNEVIIVPCMGFDRSLKKNMVRVPSKFKGKKKPRRVHSVLSATKAGIVAGNSEVYSVGDGSRMSDERYDTRPAFKEQEMTLNE